MGSAWYLSVIVIPEFDHGLIVVKYIPSGAIIAARYAQYVFVVHMFIDIRREFVDVQWIVMLVFATPAVSRAGTPLKFNFYFGAGYPLGAGI